MDSNTNSKIVSITISESSNEGVNNGQSLNDDNMQSSQYFTDSNSTKNSSQNNDKFLRVPTLNHNHNRFFNTSFNQPSLAQMTMTSLLDDSSKSGVYEDSIGGEWSKQSLEHFFNPLESFLDIQLRRERSSKRRCREVVRKRELDQQRMFVENKLREFDEKINLNGLLKRSKEAAAMRKTPTVEGAYGGLTNNIRVFEQPNHQCSRCTFFQRCYEENGALGHKHLVENGNKAKNKQQRQPRRIRLPNISLLSKQSPTGTNSTFGSRQNYLQTGSMPYLNNNFSMKSSPSIKF